MGQSLSSTQIRATYIGLLKTDDNNSIGGALKTISDGSGNDTALRISTNEVNVGSLSIESVPGNPSATKMLMWNDSTKDVQYRNYNPTGVNSFNATSFSTGDGGATVQIDSSTAVLTINAGSNIQVTGSGSSITIDTSLGDAAEQISMDLTATDVNQGAGDFYQQINFDFRDYQNTLTRSTLRGSGGVTISNEDNATNGKDFVIDGGTVTWVVDNPPDGSASSLAASMDLTDVTASNLIVLVDTAIINQVYSTEAQRTIMLPPPYLGRRIEVFFTRVTATNPNSTYPEPQDYAEPIVFAIANSSDKDPSVRFSGFAGRAVVQSPMAITPSGGRPFGIQSFGPGSKKDYLKFQDTSETELDVNGNEIPSAGNTVRGLGDGTRFVMYGVSNDCYLCDIRVFCNFGSQPVGCRIFTD